MFTLTLLSLLVENHFFVCLNFLTQMSKKFLIVPLFFTIMIKFTLSVVYQDSQPLALAPLAQKGNKQIWNLVKIFSLKQKEYFQLKENRKQSYVPSDYNF